MVLEGVVTNVAAFGAFVDIGVHQDGLVHISALSNTFVKDPHAVVKVSQVVQVRVVEVDEKRKRIALTMRLSEPSQRQSQSHSQPQSQPLAHSPRDNKSHNKSLKADPQMNNAMAAAFKKVIS